MKKLYIALAFAMAAQVTFAQNAETEKADKLFSRFEYVDAAKEYLKIAQKKKDPYVYKQLADSYFNVFNSKEAVKWYAKAVESKQDAETYFRYAQMLKAEGKYEESNEQMKKFAKLAPNDQRAAAFNQDPNYLPKLRSQAKLFDEKILDINDEKYSDFGGVLFDDNTFYFTSSRNILRKKYGRNEEPYLDMYSATYNNGTFSKPEAISEINTQWHDGPATVSADGKVMYFSSESFKNGTFEKSEGGVRTGLIHLFRAEKKDGKWTNIKPVPFNGKDWSTGNASLSKDGKWLYFASNRKGSMGGSTDIWKVEIKGANSYGEPINLGPKVNTEGRENFPSITDDNKLYFASDSRKGFGGLDIFVIDLQHDGEALNVGQPVNTQFDDFAFNFNVTHNIGFFASNRAGKDNLYQAIPVCGVEAVVVVTDESTGKPIPAAKVAILDEKNNVIETRTTATDGVITYSVDCNKAFVLQAEALGYENATFKLPANKGGRTEIPAPLKPLSRLIVDNKIMLNNIYFEFNKSFITQDAAFELNKLVQILQTNPTMVITVKAHTDSRGSDEYNLKLSDERAKATVQYVISQGIAPERISGKGYGETEPLIKCGENCTEEEHAKNRRTEFIIVKK
ncbi:OmpA family protein [Flavobacterium sp. RHBU_3]|uniref:OmpA family protein n=1 Tax=Flavobacterium sp. RHBU_3 TaxID=3391184 RepID=UPI00398533A7